MEKTMYRLYFEEKKEIKVIAEILGVTYSHIRKVLSDKYHNLYLEEKALRQSKRAEIRKIKEKERKSKYKALNEDNEFYYL